METKKIPGRPQKLDKGYQLQIKRMLASDPFISAPDISAELLRSSNIKVTPETVRKTIIKLGYRSRVPRKKPLVNLVNRKKRLAFAYEYQNASSEFWENVIFSDESKFNIFGSDGRM